MKTKFLMASILLATSTSHAVPFFQPSRCTHDNLPQWTDGTPIAGTARGRNEWLKVCEPKMYKAVFPGGNEFDPNISSASDKRRSYPTYGIITGYNSKNEPVFTTNGYVAPKAPPANAGAKECIVPEPNEFVGLCTSGCVVPETQVATVGGAFQIGDLYDAKSPSVLVPTENASGALTLEPQRVRSYLRDVIDAHQEVLVIKTMSGGSVVVSTNHPLLTAESKMAKAEDLKAGDSLVTADGKKDLITAIEKQAYYGKLYNLTIDTADKAKSLFVVQGYISGDKKFQDQDVSEFNRRVLRRVAFKTLAR